MMNRRAFLLGGAGFPSSAANPETYRFAMPECEIEMRVEFHDRYSSRGLCFRDLSSDRPFCFAAGSFTGAIAIAHYRVRMHSGRIPISVLREYVQTIDHHPRCDFRPPCESRMELRRGVASDIQAFGLDGSGQPDPSEPWYYFRQDLYLDVRSSPFLVIHWKHELNAIRLLDVIPGDGTQVVSR